MKDVSLRTFQTPEEVQRQKLQWRMSNVQLFDVKNLHVRLPKNLKLFSRFSFMNVFSLSLSDFFSQYLEDIDEDLSTKCSDLKSYIQSVETGFTKQLEGLSRTLEENEQRYSEDYTNTQEKIVAINEKVVETRQIIGGTSGGSKVSFAPQNKFLKLYS